MRLTGHQWDLLSYFAIGALTAMQTQIAANNLPKWLEPWVVILLGGWLTVKAKRSNGNPKDRTLVPGDGGQE